jgi:uncharacterized protein YndB with AHSA1/START domain
MSAEPTLPTARVERVLAASRTGAYDAWLDVATLKEFICPAPGRAAEVAVDATIGGGLRFLMSFPDAQIEVTGEFLILDRPECISFTWRCSDTGDLESIVTVYFAPRGADGTLMTIVHSKQPSALVPKHQAGWSSVAEQLQAKLARG